MVFNHFVHKAKFFFSSLTFAAKKLCGAKKPNYCKVCNNRVARNNEVVNCFVFFFHLQSIHFNSEECQTKAKAKTFVHLQQPHNENQCIRSRRDKKKNHSSILFSTCLWFVPEIQNNIQLYLEVLMILESLAYLCTVAVVGFFGLSEWITVLRESQMEYQTKRWKW